MTDSIQVFDLGYQVTDSAGVVQSRALLSFYDAGTSNARTVYSDVALTVSLGVTVTTDAAGRPAAAAGAGAEVLIYTGKTAYKVVAVDSASVALWTFDSVWHKRSLPHFTIFTNSHEAERTIIKVEINQLTRRPTGTLNIK